MPRVFLVAEVRKTFPVSVKVRIRFPVSVTVARVSRRGVAFPAVAVTTWEHWSPVRGCVPPYSLVFVSNVLWEQDVGGSNPLAPTKPTLFMPAAHQAHSLFIVAAG